MEIGLDKVFIVLPAYNAEKTLQKTYWSIPESFRKHIILIDDFSKDETVKLSRALGIETFRHFANLGYGANQKTCYYLALDKGADVVVMLHPDYQYFGEDIPKLISPILKGEKDMMLGSRIKFAREGKMPIWKYFSNRLLTIIEKVVLRNLELHEFHSGFRAYSAEFLRSINYNSFNNDFSFDSQMIFACIKKGYRIGEIETKTRYFKEASSIRPTKAFSYALHTIYYMFK